MATKKKAAAKKPAPKNINRAHGDIVTSRFILAMERIISKREGSLIRTVKDFAASIHCDNVYLGKVINPKYNMHANLHMIVELCLRHSVNGEWLITGKGEMFGDETIQQQVSDINNRLKIMEAELIKAQAKNKK